MGRAREIPEYFANGVDRVEVIGPVTRFVMHVLRKRPSGKLYLAEAFAVTMPSDAVPPGIEMTLTSMEKTSRPKVATDIDVPLTKH